MTKSYTSTDLLQQIERWIDNDQADKITIEHWRTAYLSAYDEIPKVFTSSFRGKMEDVLNGAFGNMNITREGLYGTKSLFQKIKSYCDENISTQPESAEETAPIVIDKDPEIEKTAKNISRYSLLASGFVFAAAYYKGGLFFFLGIIVVAILVFLSFGDTAYDMIKGFRQGQKNYLEKQLSAGKISIEKREAVSIEPVDEELEIIQSLINSYLRNESTLKTGFVELLAVKIAYLESMQELKKINDVVDDDEIDAAVRDKIFEEHTDIVTGEFKTILDEEYAFRIYMLWRSLKRTNLIEASTNVALEGVNYKKDK